MAGGGANGQQGIVVAKPPKKPKHRLTYKALTVYDDLVTETLVDNVYYWSQIRKNNPDFVPNPLAQTDNIVNLIRKHVIPWKNYTDVERELLKLPAIANFYQTLESPRHKDDFRGHLERYINLYRTDCPWEIGTTNRFTISRQEASIIARRSIKAGARIKYLLGLQVQLLSEDEAHIRESNRDFSVVISSRSNQASIFLGPARFCNHDCNSNAILNPVGNEGMEVLAKRDIPAGEEITVNYADNYFDEDNSKCLCETCEQKLDNGWAQYNENGERILPASTEEVEDLDQNGRPRRTLRERNMDKDYKERPPTPSPPPVRGRRKRASSPPPVPAVLLNQLSEEFIKDEDEDLPDAPLVVKEPTPKPEPKPKRRVPRKQPARNPNKLYRGQISVFPGVREKWIVDEGSTDESSSEDEAEEVTAKSAAANLARKEKDNDWPIMKVGVGEVSRLRNGGRSRPLDPWLSTRASVNAKKRREVLLSSSTTPDQQPSQRLANDMMQSGRRTSVRLSSTPVMLARGSMLQGVAPQRQIIVPKSPASEAGEKRSVAQISSRKKLVRPKDPRTGQCRPLGTLISGASSQTPMDIESGNDSDDAASHQLGLNNAEAEDKDKAKVKTDLSPGVGDKAEGPLDREMKPLPQKRCRGRPPIVPRPAAAAAAVANFYGRGPRRAPVPRLETPENSPVKMTLASTLLRKLKPQTQVMPLAQLNLNAAVVVLGEEVNGWHGNGDADSEYGGEEASPSRLRKRFNRRGTPSRSNPSKARSPTPEPTESEQPRPETPQPEPPQPEPPKPEPPRIRVPGDYLIAPELLTTPSSTWLECKLCLEFFVQVKPAVEETHCHRCVRHAKLHGVCWPDTEPKDGEDRRADWLNVLKEGYWKGIELELRRVSRRRKAIDRARAKKKALAEGETYVDGGTKVMPLTREVVPNAENVIEEDKRDERSVNDDDAAAPQRNDSSNQMQRRKTRMAECPLCHELKPWKGTKRLQFRGGWRHVCAECYAVEKPDNATVHGKHTKDPRNEDNDDSSPSTRGSKPESASPDPDAAHADRDALQNPGANETPIIDLDTPEEVQAVASQPSLSVDEARQRIGRCAWDVDVAECTCGLHDMIRTQEVRPDRCNLTQLGVAILTEVLHMPLMSKVATQLRQGVNAEDARDLVSEVLKAKSSKAHFEASFRIKAAQALPLSFAAQWAVCQWKRQLDAPCSCGLRARIIKEADTSRCCVRVHAAVKLAEILHKHTNFSQALKLMKTRDLREMKHIIASALRSVYPTEVCYERCYKGPHPPFKVIRTTRDTPIDVDALIDVDAIDGASATHNPSEPSTPGVHGEKTSDCRWTNQFACACGLHGRIISESARNRCHLTPLGTDALKNALHDPKYQSQAVKLMDTKGLDEVKKIVDSVLRSACRSDRILANCYASSHPASAGSVAPYTQSPCSSTMSSIWGSDHSLPSWDVAMRENSPLVDDDDDGTMTIVATAASTPLGQVPASGTRSPTTSVLETSDQDDTTSTSSIEFLSSKRLDGTRSKPQSIPSPRRRPKTRGFVDLASDDKSEVNETSSTLPDCTKADSLARKRKAPGIMDMGGDESLVDKPPSAKRQRSTMNYLPGWRTTPEPNDTPSNPTKGQLKAREVEPILVGDSPPNTRTATPADPDSDSEESTVRGGVNRVVASRAQIRQDLLRPDGMPKSAREVLMAKAAREKEAGKASPVEPKNKCQQQ